MPLRSRPIRIRPIVPLLVALAVVMLAATPALDIGARDGKAHAIASGEIDVEALQEAAVEQGIAESNPAALPLPGAECENGFAGPYPCENVDLLSIVPIAELWGATGADVWGWTDPTTGREIAISTTTFGMAFVDISEPAEPQILGRVYVGWEGSDRDVLWRDVKVYEDHAFLVSEHDDTHLVIFDLRRLREFDSDQGILEPDVVYTEAFGSAHNIAINEDTGFAYVVGTKRDGDHAGGLLMLDISNPGEPAIAGSFPEDGYTHDVQCVLYQGPDLDHQGDEICFASNEDTVTIVDVTDKENPVMLSRNEYDTAEYTHQGWLTPDHRWFVFGDELDEMTGAVSATTTYIMNVEDLESPGEIMAFEHPTIAIDHNLYIVDDLIYQANYSSGLRVLEYTEESLQAGELTTVAHFDVDPGPEAPVFAGAWTAYPFFESGTIALNSFDSGLFLLRLDLGDEEPAADDGGEDEGGSDDAEDSVAPGPDAEGGQLAATGGGGATALIGLLLGAIALGLRRRSLG